MGRGITPWHGLIVSKIRAGVQPAGRTAVVVDAAGIDPMRRPETLSIAEFVALSNLPASS